MTVRADGIMSNNSEEYREIVSLFSQPAAARHIISLAIVQQPYNFTPRMGLGIDNDSSLGDVLSTERSTTADNQTAPIIPRISAEMPIWLIPCYSIILLFAVVGNLLVISTLVQNRRMRTITNLFLLNLAISDILLGVLCMPVTLVGTLLRHFIFGEFLCKMLQFSQAASVAVSSWTLVAISCERYYAICHPLSSRAWQTLTHAYKIIAFIWFGSIFCMMPIAIFSQLMPTSRQGLRKCREHWPEDTIGYERTYNILLDLILLVVPLLILCVAYILITRTLYVGMKTERAFIFGSSGVQKVDEVATVTAATCLRRSTKTGFNFNMSRLCNGRAGDSAADRVENGEESAFANTETCFLPQDEAVQRQQRMRKDRQQGYADISPQPSGKRKFLTTTDGRRQLYSMRSASVKSLNRNNNGSSRSSIVGGAGCSTSPSSSMSGMQAPQSQRLQANQPRESQHNNDRRKSYSTPTLRITDAALRRSNETKNLESKRRVVKMLFVLVLEFFICWTPLYVINTLAMFIGSELYEYIDYTSISFFQLLAYSSSCCNPITYCFMNAGFRRAFLDTFKGLHLWRQHPKTSTNLSVAGNSITMANNDTMISQTTNLDSPRL